MFSVQRTANGFSCLCNNKSIVHEIPNEQLANQLIDKFKALDWIDWSGFPSLWLPEELAIREAIKEIEAFL